jgi:hypothetical protein
VGEGYDAFISYSHAADGAFAPALQRGLARLAKPWYQREALRIFRDDTGLAVTPELWGSIVEALDRSSYFILLASPEAAASSWVNREVEHWKTHKSMSSLLPIVTAGEWFWDDATNDLDADRSTAAPRALFGAFRQEPRHLDLRWAKTDAHLDLRNGRFRNAVAELAAPIRDVPKEELESEDLRLHRRALRLARAAVAGLVVLTVGALIAGGLAVVNANRAEDRRVEATARQLAAESVALEAQSPVEALMLGAAAHQVRATADTFASLFQLVQERPRLERFLDTTPGGTNSSLVISDDEQHVAFVHTQGTNASVVVAPIGGSGSGETLRRRVAGLEGVWFVDDRHVALVGEQLALMSIEGRAQVVAARRPGTSWTVSPDRARAVIVGRDGDSVVVDLHRARVLTSVAAPRGPSAGLVAFSHDGEHVVVPANDGWRVVATGSGEPARTVAFPADVGTVTPRLLDGGSLFGAGEHALAVLPASGNPDDAVVVPLDPADGRYWFEVSADERAAVVRTQARLLVADLASGTVRWSRPATDLAAYAGSVQVGFDGSGTTVFDVGPDGLTFSDATTGVVGRRVSGVLDLQLGPGARFAVADAAGTLDVVDLARGEVRAERDGIGPANVVAWSPDGRWLVSGGYDTVLWDLSAAPVTTEQLRVSPTFTRAAVASDRHVVTAGSETVALWRLGAVAPFGTLVRSGRGDALEALDPDGAGRFRFEGTKTGYDVSDATGKRVMRVRRPGAAIQDASVLWGARRALVEYDTPDISGLDLVDLEHGRVVRTGVVCGATQVDQLAASADGTHLLATIDADTTRRGGERLRSCSTSDGHLVASMIPPGGVTGTAGPNRDGTRAAYPSQGDVHIADLRRHRDIARFPMPGPARWEGLGGRAAFSSDDRRVFAEWYFGAVVRDLLTGRSRSVRRSHLSTTWLPQRIDLDPTGRIAAVSAAALTSGTGELAAEVSLVDLHSMEVLGPVQLPSVKLVTSVRAAASARRIEVTGYVEGANGTFRGAHVRLDLGDDRLAALACRLLGHTPSRREWRERLPTTDYVEVCRR